MRAFVDGWANDECARPCRNHILPICLPSSRLEIVGRSGVIAGWGKTQANMGHTGTNVLQSAAVPIISRSSGSMHTKTIV